MEHALGEVKQPPGIPCVPYRPGGLAGTGFAGRDAVSGSMAVLEAVSRWRNVQLLVIQPRGLLVSRDSAGLSPEGRDAIRSVAARSTVVLLDHEAPDALERWLAECARESVQAFWPGRLGRQARPPSPLPFRWLARRFGHRPSECLCVAGSEWLLRGARRAGWQATLVPGPGGRGGIDLLHELAAR